MSRNVGIDRRAQKTRAGLQNALIELLREKGLAQIQIKELTERANLSRQVFYLHFDSKEELLFSYVDDVFAQIYEAVFADAHDASNLQREMPLVLSFQQWAKHAEALQWVMQIENKDPLIDRLRDHIAVLIEDLADHPDTEARKSPIHEHVVDFVAGGAYMLLKRWFETGMKKSPEEMGSLTYQLLESLSNDLG